MVRGVRKCTQTKTNKKKATVPSPVKLNFEKGKKSKKVSLTPVKFSKGKTLKQYLQVVDLTPSKPCIDINQTSPEICSEKMKCSQEYFKASTECEIITDQPCQITETSPPTPHRIKLEQPPVSLSTNPNKKGKLPKGGGNHVITEYFPVRRSNRKPKKIVLAEQKQSLRDAIKDDVEQGLDVCYFEGKGRGVVATQEFNRGDYVVEYRGDLIDTTEAKCREQQYARDQSTGCYMYYFKYKNRSYCVDATRETPYLGRLVNHSRNGNLMTRVEVVDGVPHLVLLAKEHIQIGQELTYDYGDRSKESLKHHPWLAM